MTGLYVRSPNICKGDILKDHLEKLAQEETKDYLEKLAQEEARADNLQMDKIIAVYDHMIDNDGIPESSAATLTLAFVVNKAVKGVTDAIIGLTKNQ
jgi:hypothetical protein